MWTLENQKNRDYSLLQKLLYYLFGPLQRPALVPLTLFINQSFVKYEVQIWIHLIFAIVKKTYDRET